MFRGLVQTFFSAQHGPVWGLFIGMIFFGLRHLPADIFCAQVWNATTRMWLARQMDLYSFALVLGLAHHFGTSTYAPGIAHTLMYFANLFS